MPNWFHLFWDGGLLNWPCGVQICAREGDDLFQLFSVYRFFPLHMSISVHTKSLHLHPHQFPLAFWSRLATCGWTFDVNIFTADLPPFPYRRPHSPPRNVRTAAWMLATIHHDPAHKAVLESQVVRAQFLRDSLAAPSNQPVAPWQAEFIFT